MEQSKTIDLSNDAILHDVFIRYNHALCFYAARMLHGTDIPADDIVQDVFISVWKRKLIFKNSHTLKAYLYYFVHHSCLNAIKSAGIHKRHHRHIFDEHSRLASEESHFLYNRIETEVLAEIFEAIEQLPPQCCRIFKLSYMEGMSVEQVADELELSVNTVKTQRGRAKKQLKEHLKNLYIILFQMFLS